MKNKVEFKETIELFLTRTIYDLLYEKETPKINIIFNEDGYNLFNETMNKPHKLKKYYTPNIKIEDIKVLDKLKNNNCPTLYIKNANEFFKYLTNITNELLKLYENYYEICPPRQLLMNIMKRIWLRMSPNDFNNVETFLHNQLTFVKNDLFKEYKKETTINKFKNYDITAQNTLNRTWDESTKCMSFTIYDNYNVHSLPNIYYDVIKDTCYIYAIQNDRHPYKIPEIEKEIYKLYRGNGQPNKVYAIKIFINMLKEKGIKTIKVPTLQVLNYRYHELLSKKVKKDFEKEWNKERLENLKKLTEKEYEKEKYFYNLDKTWYDHIVSNEDKISKIKTEDLINLIYRIVKEDNSLTITNDIDISDTLDIKIKTLKQDN